MSVKDGTTSLVAASLNGHLDVVKLLLEKNANIEARGTSDHARGCFLCLLCMSDKNGATSLFIASQNGHLDLMKLLLENNANTEASRRSNHPEGC